MFNKTSIRLAILGIVTVLLVLVSLHPQATPPAYAQEGEGAQEGESECVACHSEETPGIVSQWQAGAMGQAGLDCTTCHGSNHQDATDVAEVQLPTPDTCGQCHPDQIEQYRDGKHALAWAAMKAMPMIAHQPLTVTGPEGFKGCSGCHKIGEKSAEEIQSDEFHYGTGSCDSCHTRHSFSIAEARDPRACQTCHMGFDHPQWEMWSTSKHGTIWQVEGDTGRAPTCQTCHMADGDHGVMTAWGFLALRVPEKDEDWWADRVEILKALGVLDENGEGTERLEAVQVAKVARLTEEGFRAEREEMEAICADCHAAGFVAEQLAAGDNIIRETDKIMAESIRTVKALYDEGLLTVPEGWKYAPDLLQFYEAQSSIEQELWVMFLEYRNRAFQGAFHANPDYMHWYGWAAMKEGLQRVKDEAARIRAEAAAEVEQEATQDKIAAAQQEAASAQQQISTLQSGLDQATSDVDKLSAENEKLQNEISAAGGAHPIAWGAIVVGLVALGMGGIAFFRQQG
ncbi:MAG: Hydrazine dehydrogenase [Anaerolineales bacterium]|nr:Hydrazine dehydrogenase [Anaerolineales bacterium]